MSEYDLGIPWKDEPNERDEPTPLPFFEFGVTRWEVKDGQDGYLELESHPDGTFLFGGRINGQYFEDEDREDFFFANSDELLAFFDKNGLTEALSRKAT